MDGYPLNFFIPGSANNKEDILSQGNGDQRDNGKYYSVV